MTPPHPPPPRFTTPGSPALDAEAPRGVMSHQWPLPTPSPTIHYPRLTCPRQAVLTRRHVVIAINDPYPPPSPTIHYPGLTCPRRFTTPGSPALDAEAVLTRRHVVIAINDPSPPPSPTIHYPGLTCPRRWGSSHAVSCRYSHQWPLPTPLPHDSLPQAHLPSTLWQLSRGVMSL